MGTGRSTRSRSRTARSGIGRPMGLRRRGRRRDVLPGQRPPGDVHRRLGDAVHVDQPAEAVAETREPGGELARIERLAAEDDQA